MQGGQRRFERGLFCGNSTRPQVRQQRGGAPEHDVGWIAIGGEDQRLGLVSLGGDSLKRGALFEVLFQHQELAVEFLAFRIGRRRRHWQGSHQCNRRNHEAAPRGGTREQV